MQPIISIAVLGISIFMPLESNKVQNYFYGNLRAGTSVFFSLSLDTKYTFRAVDIEKSKLLKIVDDKGISILPDSPEDYPNPFMRGIFCTGPISVNNDESIMLLGINTPKFPSSDATSLDIEAEIYVNVATGENRTEAANVTLAKDVTFSLDDIDFVISKVESSTDFHENEYTEVTIKYETTIENFKKLVFKNSTTGEEIKCYCSGSSSFYGTDIYKCSIAFHFPGQSCPDSANIELITYADIHAEKIEIKKTVSIIPQAE